MFKSMLTPEQRDRITAANLERSMIAQLSDRKFLDKLLHNLHNCRRTPTRDGDPTYDATRDHMLLPELVRRFVKLRYPELFSNNTTRQDTPILCPVCNQLISGRDLF